MLGNQNLGFYRQFLNFLWVIKRLASSSTSNTFLGVPFLFLYLILIERWDYRIRLRQVDAMVAEIVQSPEPLLYKTILMRSQNPLSQAERGSICLFSSTLPFSPFHFSGECSWRLDPSAYKSLCSYTLFYRSFILTSRKDKVLGFYLSR